MKNILKWHIPCKCLFTPYFTNENQFVSFNNKELNETVIGNGVHICTRVFFNKHLFYWKWHCSMSDQVVSCGKITQIGRSIWTSFFMWESKQIVVINLFENFCIILPFFRLLNNSPLFWRKYSRVSNSNQSHFRK